MNRILHTPTVRDNRFYRESADWFSEVVSVILYIRLLAWLQSTLSVFAKFKFRGKVSCKSPKRNSFSAAENIPACDIQT